MLQVSNLEVNKMYKYNLVREVPEMFLDMQIKDMLCKHVLNASEGIESQVLKESLEIGYKWCLWGSHSGHDADISYHLDKIHKMESDEYYHALRIVVYNYGEKEKMYVWCDNIHSAIRYIRKYGLNVKLSQVPFYIVDLRTSPITVAGYKDYLKEDNTCIQGAIRSALKRACWSNSRELLGLNFTIGQFVENHKKVFLEG